MSDTLTKRGDNYSQWYNELVIKSGLAEYSAVRGCMVIKPYGYAIWEEMKSVLDKKFKETGHLNASFPLLIPKSFFSKEASHVEGFAKECAIVTHYRLKNDPETNEIIVDPDAKLEEELIIRPTSETIMWHSYKNWIKSYRDLPLLINQWANVMRWEMRTRLFLRTAEFFWQEGHTAHATRQEAIEEARQMLDVYADFMEKYLAIPVIKGVKTESERFAGANDTYTVEGLMQDGKALQMGTSHFLGQNFAKAFDVKFLNREGTLEYVWGTSWGVSTRMMGALIMAHSDDEGLVLPPNMAPLKTVFVPIFRKDEELAMIREKADVLISGLKAHGINSKFDDSDKRPGWKFAEYELQGVPVRIAMGPRDVKNNSVEIVRRDTKEKTQIPFENAVEYIKDLLPEMQQSIYDRALKFRDSNITKVDNFDEFREVIDGKGGFISAHWDGTAETEAIIKEKTKATIRCIPMDSEEDGGHCVYSGKASAGRVLFAKSY